MTDKEITHAARQICAAQCEKQDNSDSVAKSVVNLYRFDTENDRLRALEAIAVYKTRQPQTDATIEAQAAEIERLRDALSEVLPFTATFSVGCHGEKCRLEWCHSCRDEDDAEQAGMRGLHAYQKGQRALEQSK